MLRAIQEFFASRIEPDLSGADAERSEHALELATAALLIEVSRADFKTDAGERDAVVTAVREAFGLSAEECDEILRFAEEEVERSISIYEFTRLLDRTLSPEKKQYVVELLWRVALSDAHVDPHEEHLIRKAAKLLHVHHRDSIEAKIRVQRRLRTS